MNAVVIERVVVKGFEVMTGVVNVETKVRREVVVIVAKTKMDATAVKSESATTATGEKIKTAEAAEMSAMMSAHALEIMMRAGHPFGKGNMTEDAVPTRITLEGG